MEVTNTKTEITREMIEGPETNPVADAARLDSWKDIANYLNRNVRTVQRWEALEAMPIHRHGHGSGASVYGYEDELDAWRAGRSRRKLPNSPTTGRNPAEDQVQAVRVALRTLLEALMEQLAEGMSFPITHPTTNNPIRHGKVRETLRCPDNRLRQTGGRHGSGIPSQSLLTKLQ